MYVVLSFSILRLKRRKKKSEKKRGCVEISSNISLVEEISNPGFINSYLPNGILLVKNDESFTISQANHGFFDLVGYTREDLRERFSNKLMAMLHPEDAQKTFDMLSFRMTTSSTSAFSVSSRIANKYLGHKVIQFSGMLMADGNGSEDICFVLTDITSHIDTLNELEQERDFNSLIASMTNSSFFDLNLSTEQLRLSKSLADRLELPILLDNFPYILEDLGIISKGVNEFLSVKLMNSTTSNFEEQLPLTSPDGETLWFLVNFSVLRDENSTPLRVVGKLTDITNHQNQIKELSSKADYDQLTNIYNKAKTESLIKSFLSNANPLKNTGALMLIDLDRFKEINDSFGHRYGDDVLVDVANTLTDMFRTNDIVGRIGGDEFFVFMKDFKNVDIVQQKARTMCQRLERTYTQNDHSITVSASIGISIYHQSGTDFNTLYENADIALYGVKKDGKNNYRVFNNEERPIYLAAR